MQLLKYLQAQGLGSRKQCQWLIENDCVYINDALHQHAKDVIDINHVFQLLIDGEEIQPIPLPFFYILLNKPEDHETSHKPQHYPSIFSLLPTHLRQLDMQAVGRLDADTTGIILITNDGQFNHRSTSPKHKLPKIYRVHLKHPANDALCTQLKSGVRLHDDNETVQAEDAQLRDENTLIMTITQGKYHQVKRMIAAAGNRVAHLHREQFGPWRVDDLASGQWRFFQPDAPINQDQTTNTSTL